MNEIERQLGTPGDDPVEWLEHAAEMGLCAALVPVTVGATPGIGHAAYTDHGGAHDIAANSNDSYIRATAAVAFCFYPYGDTVALAEDARPGFLS